MSKVGAKALLVRVYAKMIERRINASMTARFFWWLTEY